MTAGDIIKEENLIVEVFTVKSEEDIELGEVVYNDGNGVLAATNAALGPYFLALEAHDYSEVSDHDIMCLVAGIGDTQTEIANNTVVGRYVEIGLNAGEVTCFDYSSPGNWYDVVGIAMEATTTANSDCKVLFGHNG